MGIKRKKYTNDNSDDLNDSDYSDNSDNSDNESIENISNNKIQYYKFLNKIFPSNYSKIKIKKVKRQRLLNPISRYRNSDKNIKLILDFKKNKNNNYDDNYN